MILQLIASIEIQKATCHQLYLQITEVVCDCHVIASNQLLGRFYSNNITFTILFLLKILKRIFEAPCKYNLNTLLHCAYEMEFLLLKFYLLLGLSLGLGLL